MSPDILRGLRWFGFSADTMRLDLRWGDFGHFGAFDGVRRTTGDPGSERSDRAVIAALGPVLGGTSLEHPSSAADRRAIDLNVEPGWGVDAWRWLTTERARRLARDESFRTIWKHFVLALDDLGERFVELQGDEVTEFIERSAVLGCVRTLDREPRPKPGLSQRWHSGVKARSPKPHS